MKCWVARMALAMAIGQGTSICLGQSTTAKDIPTELQIGTQVSIDLEVVQKKLALTEAEARVYAESKLPLKGANIPTLARVGVPQNYAVNYRTDGSKAFYAEDLKLDGARQQLLSDAPTKLSIILDETRTFLVFGDGRSVTVEDKRSDRDMHFLPLPGVGLPGTPIVRDSGGVNLNPKGVKIPDGYELIKVPYAMETLDSAYRYRAGLLKTELDGGKAKVISIVGGLPNHAAQTWEFKNYFKVGDSWVARDYTWHQFDLTANGGATKELMQREFHVLSVDQGPIPAETFDPRHYIKPGAMVLFKSADSDALTSTIYDPSLSWEDMQKRAEPYGMGHSAESRLRPERFNYALGVAGLVIPVALVALVLYRKTTHPREAETK